jgi:XisH protein
LPPSGGFIGARLGERNIAVEIKEFRGNSAIADLEQAIGQYILYRLLLNQVDLGRKVYLAIPERIFDTIFTEPVGELVIRELPLKLIIIDEEKAEVSQWIPPYETGKL